jgi:hypothetical protein
VRLIFSRSIKWKFKLFVVYKNWTGISVKLLNVTSFDKNVLCNRSRKKLENLVFQSR